MIEKLPSWETDPGVAKCQSCSRPMTALEDFGSVSAGERSEKYCNCCLQDGHWIEPDVSMQELIDRCVEIWVENEISTREDAADYFAHLFPTLERWNEQPAARAAT